MKFTLEGRTGAHLIRGYSRGEIRIGEAVVTQPFLVTADTLVLDWPATSIDALDDAQLGRIIDLAPEVVVLGCPPPVPLPSGRLRGELGRRGIGVEVMELGAACRTYNVLVQEERRVVAGLFPG